MAESTRRRHPRKAATTKPPKPYPEFPLGAANNGYWQKKIRGRIHYFGRWGKAVNGRLEILPNGGQWQAALELYKRQIDDLQAGRKPRLAASDGLTVGELRERFLTVKSRALDAGEITAPTYFEYKRTTNRLVRIFGERRLVEDLASDDFEALRADIVAQWGPVRTGNEIQRVRSIFKFGFEAGLIGQAVRFGPAFRKPSAKVLRTARAKAGERMIEAAEIRRLLRGASPQQKAWVLLCVNCGFTNKDIGDLPRSALDLAGGWVDFPRPKTGVVRRAKLWPETVAAIRDWLGVRPEPQKASAGLVFLTETGNTWITSGTANTIARDIRKLLKRLNLHRHRIGLATLRHVFRTVADETKDWPAIDRIMGHADPSIAAHYRERIDDSRLAAVVDHVHAWLFAGAAEEVSP